MRREENARRGGCPGGMWNRIVPAAAISLALATPGLAQGPPPSSGLRWSLGLGVVSSPKPYKGADADVMPIPFLELSYKRFYFQGIRFGYKLVDGTELDLDVRGRYRFAGYEEDDSPYLAGMEERQGSVDGGLALEWRRGRFGIATTAFADLLGRSSGVEVGVDVSWAQPLADRKVLLTPAVGIEWQNAGLVDYYYGVNPDEALPDRPAYEGEAMLTTRASLSLLWRASPRVTVLALVRADRLDDDVQDSPIVEKRRAVFGMAGFTYRF
jgi:outer membrane protein